jgi:predicted RNA-binding protein YlqC (UPF0109 family)
MLEDALEHLVRGIVDHDDDVSVEMTTGRRGRTATALRTVMTAIGGRGIRVDVVDTDR